METLQIFVVFLLVGLPTSVFVIRSVARCSDRYTIPLLTWSAIGFISNQSLIAATEHLYRVTTILGFMCLAIFLFIETHYIRRYPTQL